MGNIKTFTDKLVRLKELNQKRIDFKKLEKESCIDVVFHNKNDILIIDSNASNFRSIKLKRKKLEKEIFNLINEL